MWDNYSSEKENFLIIMVCHTSKYRKTILKQKLQLMNFTETIRKKLKL